MGDGLTGLTALGYAGVGAERASKWRSKFPRLAAGVAQIWEISDEAARSIGEPAAAVLAEYIPDAWLQRVTQAAPIANLLGALYMVTSSVIQAEQHLIEEFQRSFAENAEQVPFHAAQAQAANGAVHGTPPEPDLVQDMGAVADVL